MATAVASPSRHGERAGREQRAYWSVSRAMATAAGRVRTRRDRRSRWTAVRHRPWTAEGSAFTTATAGLPRQTRTTEARRRAMPGPDDDLEDSGGSDNSASGSDDSASGSGRGSPLAAVRRRIEGLSGEVAAQQRALDVLGRIVGRLARQVAAPEEVVTRRLTVVDERGRSRLVAEVVGDTMELRLELPDAPPGRRSAVVVHASPAPAAGPAGLPGEPAIVPLLGIQLWADGDAVAERHRLRLIVRHVHRRRPEACLQRGDVGAQLGMPPRVAALAPGRRPGGGRRQSDRGRYGQDTSHHLARQAAARAGARRRAGVAGLRARLGGRARVGRAVDLAGSRR